MVSIIDTARRRGHLSRGLLALAIATAMSLGLFAASAAAAGGPPVGKIYDCYSFDQLSGFENYVQAVELKTLSVYLVAPMRTGNHLSGNAATGRYRVHGGKMTFLTGAYAPHHVTGLFYRAGKNYKPRVENQYDARFDLYEHGLNFMTCYEH